MQESINIEWQALTQAIIDVLNTLNQFENNNSKSVVVFDPTEFKQENSSIFKKDFELDSDALYDWGIKVTRIRADFREVSETFRREDTF